MELRNIVQELKKTVKGRLVANAPLKNYTTWRIGGPADLLLIPQDEDDILNSLIFANEHALNVTIVGNGSNLLVKDGGIRGLTIKLSRGLTSLELRENKIVAGAGLLLPTLARYAARFSLSGLEFAVGIPGSLGGAIVMNAGSFNQQIGDIVSKIITVDFSGNYKVWPRELLLFGYRWSSLQEKKLIVLKAVLNLTNAENGKIVELMDKNLAYRREKQPLELPSAGSVFRNPPGMYAGKLIEMAGLKGLRVGDAQVSPKHANFIVNLGNATAQDVIKLMNIIQEKVMKVFGVVLVPEVKVVGEEG